MKQTNCNGSKPCFQENKNGNIVFGAARNRSDKGILRYTQAFEFTFKDIRIIKTRFRFVKQKEIPKIFSVKNRNT